MPRAIVLLVVFLDLLSAGILIPIQPFFAEALGARPALVTALEASYALTQFLMVPIWGRLSDRHGRRPVIRDRARADGAREAAGDGAVASDPAGGPPVARHGAVPRHLRHRGDVHLDLPAGRPALPRAGVGRDRGPRAASAPDQGRAIGLSNSMVAFGRVIGPAGAGVLLEQGLAFPFVLAAGLTSCAAALAMTLRR